MTKAEASRPELDRDLETIAAEIEGLLLSGGVKGVFAIVVTADGNVAQRFRYIENGKFALLAGVTLGTHALTHLASLPPGESPVNVASPSGPPQLRFPLVRGCGRGVRSGEIDLYFDRELTDDEMRRRHEHVAELGRG